MDFETEISNYLGILALDIGYRLQEEHAKPPKQYQLCILELYHLPLEVNTDDCLWTSFGARSLGPNRVINCSRGEPATLIYVPTVPRWDRSISDPIANNVREQDTKPRIFLSRKSFAQKGSQESGTNALV